MLTAVELGADLLRSPGRIGGVLRRVDAGTFFGHIAYVSFVARKP